MGLDRQRLERCLEPVPISPEQVGIFSRLYPMNARPIQSASGRLIKQSN